MSIFLWRIGNKFTRVNTPSSGIQIGAASITTNRRIKSLAPTNLHVIEFSWRGRCISKTMQPEFMTSFCKPSAPGTEDAFEMAQDVGKEMPRGSYGHKGRKDLREEWHRGRKCGWEGDCGGANETCVLASAYMAVFCPLPFTLLSFSLTLLFLFALPFWAASKVPFWDSLDHPRRQWSSDADIVNL